MGGPDSLRPPPLRAFRKKRRRSFAPQQRQHYWSEFDHPSDSDEGGGYVIYCDPETDTVFDRLWNRFSSIFRTRHTPEHEPLLSAADLEAGSHEDDSTSSSDEGVVPHKRHSHSYGPHARRASTQPELSSQYAASSTQEAKWLPRLTFACLASSVIILIVAFLLAATGRRKLVSEVDAGIIFAVASSLVFAVIGVGTMVRHRRSIRWFGWVFAVTILAAVSVSSGILLASIAA